MEMGNILFQDLLAVKEHGGDKVTLWDVSVPPAAGRIVIRSKNTPPEWMHTSSRDLLPAQVGATASAFISHQVNSPHE